jgi:tRNA (guanine26-N2/guanine27-N2)-dimethyltransferase
MSWFACVQACTGLVLIGWITLGPSFLQVREGQAAILFPKKNQVFYNPVQEFNRDLSCAAIQQFVHIRRRERETKAQAKLARHDSSSLPAAAAAATTTAAGDGGATPDTTPAAAMADYSDDGSDSIGEVGDDGDDGDETEPAAATAEGTVGITILEALSATGLRAVRYFKEIDGVQRVVANDYNEDAVDTIRNNVVFNGLDPATQVVPNRDDATMIMLKHRMPANERFDVIDLDPYGSPTAFLDAALSSVADGGLICVTCTDLAVLAGNHGEACFAKCVFTAIPKKKEAHSIYCGEGMDRTLCGASFAMSWRCGWCLQVFRHTRRVIAATLFPSCLRRLIFIIAFFSACTRQLKSSKRAPPKFRPCKICAKNTVAAGSLTPCNTTPRYMCTGCESFHFAPVGRTVVQGTSTKFKAGAGPPVDQSCSECGRPFQVC